MTLHKCQEAQADPLLCQNSHQGKEQTTFALYRPHFYLKLKEMRSRETPTTVCESQLGRHDCLLAPPYFAELVYKWQHPAQVHPHASAISIEMCSAFCCLAAGSRCTLCLLRLNLRGIVSPHLGWRAAHFKSNGVMQEPLTASFYTGTVCCPIDGLESRICSYAILEKKTRSFSLHACKTVPLHWTSNLSL